LRIVVMVPADDQVFLLVMMRKSFAFVSSSGSCWSSNVRLEGVVLDEFRTTTWKVLQ
jgi:hypothetical protein